MPLHADEATATLESLGVTDAVASRRYGSTDTFALARALWPRICAIAAERTAFGLPEARPKHAPVIDAAVRGATALAPLGAVLAVVSLFAAAGWPASQLLSLTAGITFALILSAGPAQAMVFRASVLMGLGQIRAADRFLLRTCAVGVAAAVALTAALVPLTFALDITDTQRWTFAGSLAGASAIWLLTARLVAGGRAGVAGLCLFGGVVAGLGYAQITGGARHAAFAAAAGAGVTCALALAAGGAPPGATRRFYKVPRGRLSLELAPFARYGVLALLVVVAPHVGAWISAAREAHVLNAIGDFEIGTTLALFPAMLGTAIIAVRDRRVWEIAVNTQRLTRAERPGVLSHSLRVHHGASLRRFVGVVVLLSLIEGGLFWLVDRDGRHRRHRDAPRHARRRRNLRHRARRLCRTRHRPAERRLRNGARKSPRTRAGGRRRGLRRARDSARACAGARARMGSRRPCRWCDHVRRARGSRYRSPARGGGFPLRNSVLT